MIVRRKPLKRSPIRRKLKQDGIKFRGGREVCEGTAWQTRRKEVHDSAGGRCSREGCTRHAPLHDLYDPATGEVWISAGHAHHLNGTRGLGGGKRDDSLKNLGWLCARCHRQAHLPAKVVPSKHP